MRAPVSESQHYNGPFLTRSLLVQAVLLSEILFSEPSCDFPGANEVQHLKASIQIQGQVSVLPKNIPPLLWPH